MIKPYFENKNITVYQGKYQNVMPQIKDESIDFCLSDFPYNVSKHTNFGSNDRKLTKEQAQELYHKGYRAKYYRSGFNFGEQGDEGSENWDVDFNVVEAVYCIAPKIKKNGSIMLFCGTEQISEIINAFKENNIFFKRQFVKLSANPLPVNTDRLYASAVENALWGVKDGKMDGKKWTFNKQNSGYDKNYEETNKQAIGNVHPNMKPLDILTRMVLRHTNPNEQVLDITAGSLTTAKAVLLAGQNRKCISIELQKSFIDKGIKHHRLGEGVLF
jgi:DNA modification methylase